MAQLLDLVQSTSPIMRVPLMVGNEWPLLILIFGPALFALVALIAGVFMLTGGRRGSPPSTGKTIVAIILLIVAFGIGGCYGLMFFAGAVY